ncbi:MAG: ATPase, T2SS/T4P/T4SS family [Ethanoligenens sp.]
MITDRFIYPNGLLLTYDQMIRTVQQYVSTERASSAKTPKTLAPVIERYLINQRVETKRALSDIAVDMAEDMSGTSFLSKYLNHLDDYPTLEEININAWNSIVLRYTDRQDEWLDESFRDPQHALDTINKLLSRSHSKRLTATTPGVVSYIVDLEGVRNTAMCEPVIPRDAGVYASIRIVRPNVVTGENILSEQELAPDMLELLRLFVKYRISTAISGEKGAGKTSILNYLLSLIDRNYRIGIIEEGGRELSLRRFDKNGRLINQVLSLLTHPSSDPEENYDASRLLELCLRFDLEYLVPQEMRSAEAYGAQEAARTGTAVFSSLHCNNADGTYPRIVTLCQKASRELSSVLLGYAVEAFPIAVYMQKMPDGNRRCLEIVEADGTDGGKLLTHPLFRYLIEDNKENDGNIQTIGHFEQVGHLSDRLRDRMLYRGASKTQLQKFL